MSNLPKGWVETTLESAGAWSSGGTPSRVRPDYFGAGVPWVKSGDLPDGPLTRTEEQITEEGLANSSAKLLPKGTISIALYGATIGKLGILTFAAATNQACANVIPNRGVRARYLFYYLLSERQRLIDLGQGGAQPNISQTILKSHRFGLAPQIEQDRIVAKLDAILERVNACQRRLDKIADLLARFRQSVLAAACSAGERRNIPVADLISQPLSNGRSVQDAVGGFPVLRLTCLKNGGIDLAERKAGKWTEIEAAGFLVRSGDFLVARGNGSLSRVGRGGLVQDASPLVVLPKSFIVSGLKQMDNPAAGVVRGDYQPAPRFVVPRLIEPCGETSGWNNANSLSGAARKSPTASYLAFASSYIGVVNCPARHICSRSQSICRWRLSSESVAAVAILFTSTSSTESPNRFLLI